IPENKPAVTRRIRNQFGRIRAEFNFQNIVRVACRRPRALRRTVLNEEKEKQSQKKEFHQFVLARFITNEGASSAGLPFSFCFSDLFTMTIARGSLFTLLSDFQTPTILSVLSCLPTS